MRASWTFSITTSGEWLTVVSVEDDAGDVSVLKLTRLIISWCSCRVGGFVYWNRWRNENLEQLCIHDASPNWPHPRNSPPAPVTASTGQNAHVIWSKPNYHKSHNNPFRHISNKIHSNNSLRWLMYPFMIIYRTYKYMRCTALAGWIRVKLWINDIWSPSTSCGWHCERPKWPWNGFKSNLKKSETKQQSAASANEVRYI